MGFERTHITFNYNKYYPYPSEYAYGYVDSRPPDDWAGNVSFADKVVLGDDLPLCRIHPDYGYYGFLTTGFEVVGGGSGSVLDHVESIELHTVEATEESETPKRTIVITAADLQAHLNAQGNALVSFKIPGEEPAPEMDGESPYVVELEKNEFVDRYDIVMKHWQGDGDYAAETGAFSSYDAQRSGAWSNLDVRTYGRPYIYKGRRPRP